MSFHTLGQRRSNHHRFVVALLAVALFSFFIALSSALPIARYPPVSSTTVIASQNNTINQTIFTGGNASFNQSLTDSLYAPISVTGDNRSWNQSFANTLYAAIGSTGGNASFNQSFTNTLYADIKWGYNQTSAANIYTNSVNNSLWTLVSNTFYLASNPSGFITASVSTLTNYFTKTEVNNSIYGNVSDKATYTYVNTVVNGNASVSGASTTYVNTVTLGNKTDLYNNLTSWTSGNFVNGTNLSGNYYNKTDTVAMISGNVSGATTTYVNNVVSGNATNVTNWAGLTFMYGNNVTMNGLINNASYLSTYNATYAGYPATWNQSINQIIQLTGNNNTWSSTYNASYMLGNNVTVNDLITNRYTNVCLLNQTNTIATSLNFTADVNSYTQIQLKNTNGGISASSDFIVSNGAGNDQNIYGDFGMNGYNYSDSAYSINGANDTYLYANGGSLAIFTSSANKKLIFGTGGSQASNIRANLTDTSLDLKVNMTIGGAAIINNGTDLCFVRC